MEQDDVKESGNQNEKKSDNTAEEKDKGILSDSPQRNQGRGLGRGGGKGRRDGTGGGKGRGGGGLGGRQN